MDAGTKEIVVEIYRQLALRTRNAHHSEEVFASEREQRKSIGLETALGYFAEIAYEVDVRTMGTRRTPGLDAYEAAIAADHEDALAEYQQRERKAAARASSEAVLSRMSGFSVDKVQS